MNSMKIKLDHYNKELLNLDKELQTLPQGHIGKRGSSYYHYINREERIGISKNPELIQQLCRREYIQLRKSQIESNLVATSPSDIDSRTPLELIASLRKAYQDVPISYFYHPSIAAWLAKPKKTNTLYPESAIYSYNGINFRSIAERTIAEQLDNYGLLFQYEPTYDLGHTKLSPDFLIINPFNAKTVIWEHFGAFNQKDYADSMNNKMDTYIKRGYNQSKNLIATYQYHIRKIERIQELIEQIIL